MKAFIEVQAAEMVFNTKKGQFHALREINLLVQRGEFVTLIGHSGCGKSTLLNLIAGLILPSSGVLLSGRGAAVRGDAFFSKKKPRTLAGAVSTMCRRLAFGM